jgi:hypothetical protein
VGAADGAARWAREFGLEREQTRRQRPSTGTRAKRSRTKQRTQPPTRLWDDERIEGAIAPLVKELGRWPTKSEFRRAGLGAALSAVYDHGGSRRWQRRLSVKRERHKGPVPDRTRWTPQRIESELRTFCRGRSTWPGHREFREHGAGRLYSAVCRHGGTRMWRERLGLS